MRLTRSTVGNQNGLDWKAATRAWENWASQASGLRVGQFLTGAGGGARGELFPSSESSSVPPTPFHENRWQWQEKGTIQYPMRTIRGYLENFHSGHGAASVVNR